MRVKGREKVGNREKFREHQKKKKNWNEKKGKTAMEKWEKGTGEVHINGGELTEECSRKEGMENNKCIEEERYEGKEYGRSDRKISGQTEVFETH